MATNPDYQIPDHISGKLHGITWPPNRPAKATKTTAGTWHEQDPTIRNISRRPMPRHFARAFEILGWRAAPDYYRTNWRIIGRWVNEAGKADLQAKRKVMRRNPERHKLVAAMAAYWNCEPREPEWVLEKKG